MSTSNPNVAALVAQDRHRAERGGIGGGTAGSGGGVGAGLGGICHSESVSSVDSCRMITSNGRNKVPVNSMQRTEMLNYSYDNDLMTITVVAGELIGLNFEWVAFLIGSLDNWIIGMC